jgi:hypothetical protein
LLKPVTVRRDGLLAARSQAQDAGEIAGKLDLEPTVVPTENFIRSGLRPRIG